jgi:hypothetical protein
MARHLEHHPRHRHRWNSTDAGVASSSLLDRIRRYVLTGPLARAPRRLVVPMRAHWSDRG